MTRILTIKAPDVSNGPGLRLSLFVSGCDLHCKGCFNTETWAWDQGSILDPNAPLSQEFEELEGLFQEEGHPTPKTQSEALNQILEGPIKGRLSLLGGEPLHPRNLPGLIKLLDTLKVQDLWVWSGYTLEGLKLLSETEPTYGTLFRRLLDHDPTLVLGPFLEDQKDLRLAFRGSKNQQILTWAGPDLLGPTSWEDQSQHYDVKR